MVEPKRVAVVTLGCARNEVDSDELAGRLDEHGWQLVEDADEADAVVVNTCGFIEAAKKDSIDTILALKGDGSDGPTVVAVGCLAERYGEELSDALPEADGVLGFDSYPDIATHLQSIVSGQAPHPHTPQDRRKLLPLSPSDRQSAGGEVPGHSSHRHRLATGPVESVKIASGCDRRCSFCAIPSFRGSFLSRRPHDVLSEARDLVDQGVRELHLVSENSTSYGKDLGDMRLLDTLLTELANVHEDLRIRVAYLQPAEIRPALLSAMIQTPQVANYFDLSFQHASPTVLRRMRRFGGHDDFLDLVDRIRAGAPEAGIRTNFIVGFPGETEEDLDTLISFVESAQLDAIGVFGYSDEDGTEAVQLEGHLDTAEIAARVDAVSGFCERVVARRAQQRVGSEVHVLIERIEQDGTVVGRAEHQGPEDGEVSVELVTNVGIGDLVRARVQQTAGVDLHAVEVR